MQLLFQQLIHGTILFLYVNGKLVKTADPTTTTMNAAGTDHFLIGANSASGVPHTSGHPDFVVDDVMIYDKFLEAAEVKRNYNAGKRSHR